MNIRTLATIQTAALLVSALLSCLSFTYPAGGRLLGPWLAGVLADVPLLSDLNPPEAVLFLLAALLSGAGWLWARRNWPALVAALPLLALQTPGVLSQSLLAWGRLALPRTPEGAALSMALTVLFLVGTAGCLLSYRMTGRIRSQLEVAQHGGLIDNDLRSLAEGMVAAASRPLALALAFGAGTVAVAGVLVLVGRPALTHVPWPVVALGLPGAAALGWTMFAALKRA